MATHAAADWRMVTGLTTSHEKPETPAEAIMDTPDPNLLYKQKGGLVLRRILWTPLLGDSMRAGSAYLSQLMHLHARILGVG